MHGLVKFNVFVAVVGICLPIRSIIPSSSSFRRCFLNPPVTLMLQNVAGEMKSLPQMKSIHEYGVHNRVKDPFIVPGISKYLSTHIESCISQKRIPISKRNWFGVLVKLERITSNFRSLEKSDAIRKFLVFYRQMPYGRATLILETLYVVSARLSLCEGLNIILNLDR